MMLSKNILFVTVAMFLTATSAVANASAEQCAEMYKKNPPKVNITYNYGALKYDTSKTSKELDKMYEILSQGKPTHNIHGLTYLEPNVTTSVKMDSRLMEDMNYCFYPSSIEIKTWYNPTIYIANSLKAGTCRFNTTVRHEQTHLDLGHDALYLFAKSLRWAEPEILASVKPVVGDISSIDGNKIVKDFTDAYHAQVKINFEKFKKDLEKYNSIIDTDDNYKDETNLCIQE
jgi:hypothetical protein